MMFGEYLNYLAVCKEHEYEEYEAYKLLRGEIEQQTQSNDQEVAYLAQNEIFPHKL